MFSDSISLPFYAQDSKQPVYSSLRFICFSRFKDGKPYPWPNDVSSLILYPEAENQTIYTRSASFADVGNYTCTLRNDTHKSEHLVALNVQRSVPDNPLPTFRPQNQFVPLDESARLYCEAFVGKVRLPDARSSIAWYQVFENENVQQVDGQQETITRYAVE